MVHLGFKNTSTAPSSRASTKQYAARTPCSLHPKLAQRPVHRLLHERDEPIDTQIYAHEGHENLPILFRSLQPFLLDERDFPSSGLKSTSMILARRAFEADAGKHNGVAGGEGLLDEIRRGVGRAAVVAFKKRVRQERRTQTYLWFMREITSQTVLNLH
uniref:Uncharacterized protein n=1 Tax=Mycena chlorophos TaxID=658473 RepID=A0ABQ0LCC1_MYCCL|nr:predicted protein [Mycena chlorophos]